MHAEWGALMEDRRGFWIMVAIAAGVVALAMLGQGRRHRYGGPSRLDSGPDRRRRVAVWSEGMRLAPDDLVSGSLRPAGSEAKRDRPRWRQCWDEVDEASDESFPASDSPFFNP
jgi:hypothetical protein